MQAACRQVCRSQGRLAQRPKASAAAEEEDATAGLDPEQAELLTVLRDDYKPGVDGAAERTKAKVRFARYCLKEVLFLYRDLRDQA